MKTPKSWIAATNLNFHPNRQINRNFKTPKIEITFHAQILALDSTNILAPDLLLVPRLHLSSLTLINFQQNVSSNFELFFWFCKRILFRFYREGDLRYEREREREREIWNFSSHSCFNSFYYLIFLHNCSNRNSICSSFLDICFREISLFVPISLL